MADYDYDARRADGVDGIKRKRNTSELQNDLLEYLKPMIETRPYTLSAYNFIHDFVFNAETRHIVTYVAMRDFELSGYRRVILDGVRRIRDCTRFIKVGTALTVRLDDEMPNRIDISYSRHGGRANTSGDVWYTLDTLEWGRTERYLKKLEKP